MKDKILHNLGLKILAVLFSAVLWVISINITDPVESDRFTVQVELLNMNNMINEGKYVEVLDDTDTVKVEVRASSSVLSTMNASQLIVTADMNELDENNQVPISVTTSSNVNTESIVLVSKYVKVSVEDISTIQIPINVTVENEPEEGYILGTTSTVQNAMTISGPESVVSTINKANVAINVDGATSDVNINLPIKLYDSDNHVINDSKLTKSVEEVSTTATILTTKTVPLTFTVTGTPEDGYMLTGDIDQNPTNITIAGKASDVKNIWSVEIANILNVTDLTENLVMAIDITDYLPSGVILVNEKTNDVAAVTVYIEKIITKTIEINSKQIKIINMPEDFEGTISDMEDTIEIEIEGLESVVEALNPEELSGYVDIVQLMEAKDMEVLSPGSYSAGITFSLPDQVTVLDDLKTIVEINRLED
ncbi:MAG: CdaR family protein [Eubacteriales bacterium]